MSAHFEGTPYDPYGTLGTPESRHRYRPIGINRTGHMVAMQIRPYAPEASRSIMWISYGSGPFTAATPFYANVDDTPAYLRDTTPEVSTGNLYWANRLIAALATRISTKPAMRSKDLRNRPALTAIVWWNVLMPNCVRCPRKRARPNRKRVQGRGDYGKHKYCNRRQTAAVQRRNGGILAHSRYETAQRRALHVQQSHAQQFRHVRPLELSIKPRNPAKPVPMSQVSALGGRMNVGCWKRQCCFQQPYDCILAPYVSFCPYLAYIWQISGADTRHFAYIWQSCLVTRRFRG